MSLSRKHFRAIAELLNDERALQSFSREGSNAVKNTVVSMALYLKTQNPNFDRDKFYDACGFPELRRNQMTVHYVTYCDDSTLGSPYRPLCGRADYNPLYEGGMSYSPNDVTCWECQAILGGNDNEA